MPTTAITRLANRLKQADVFLVAAVVINRNSEFVADLNRDQLLDGRKASGEAMPVYTPRSLKIKSGPIGPQDTFTLKETGEFHKTIIVRADRTGLTFSSNQSFIIPIIKKETGKDPEPVLGLDNIRRILLIEWLRPLVARLYRQRIVA